MRAGGSSVLPWHIPLAEDRTHSLRSTELSSRELVGTQAGQINGEQGPVGFPGMKAVSLPLVF